MDISLIAVILLILLSLPALLILAGMVMVLIRIKDPNVRVGFRTALLTIVALVMCAVVGNMIVLVQSMVR